MDVGGADEADGRPSRSRLIGKFTSRASVSTGLG